MSLPFAHVPRRLSRHLDSPRSIFWSLCVISKPPIWKAILAALIAPGWSGTWLNIRSVGRVTERGWLCRKWSGGLDSFKKRYVESKSFDICVGRNMWKLTVIAKIPSFKNCRLLNQPCYSIMGKIIINIVMFHITMENDTAIKRRRILTYDNVTNDNDHINDSKATVMIIIKITFISRLLINYVDYSCCILLVDIDRNLDT